MARIRSIKPEFWTDEKVVALSPLARLLFIGMWNFVDDDGRAPYSPTRLKMQILPADAADISELLGEIRRNSMIEVYSVEDKEYFQVCGFSKHQKVDKRNPSKHPSPLKSAELSRKIPPDQGREGIKEGINAAPNGAHVQKTQETDLFDRGKKVLGNSAGGLIAELLKVKDGQIPLARAAIEVAATKQNPREYLNAIIRKRDPPERTVDPRL